MTWESYVDFIHYACNPLAKLPATTADIDWDAYLDYCNRQGTIGVVFDGVQRSNIPDIGVALFKWILYSEQIKGQNAQVNKRITEVIRFLGLEGFQCCILKGQANGSMYPVPDLRTPGDIDILLKKVHLDDHELSEIRQRLDEFGVMKFASGIMWIMKEVLGLEANVFITPNERIGQLILKESFSFGTHSSN